MKSEAIKIIEGPYKLHYAKSNNSKVFLPVELGEDMYNKLSGILCSDKRYEYIAQSLGKPMQFYPKDANTTLMNFGSFTSLLKNDSVTSEIAEKMYATVQKCLKQV